MFSLARFLPQQFPDFWSIPWHVQIKWNGGHPEKIQLYSTACSNSWIRIYTAIV